MRRTFLRSQWVQVGGGDGYNQGLPPYQEGGFWGTLAGPAVSYLGNLAANAGYETACRAARQFYKSHCQKKEEEEEEEEEPPRKKKKKTKRELPRKKKKKRCNEEDEETSTTVGRPIIRKEDWSYLSPK